MVNPFILMKNLMLLVKKTSATDLVCDITSLPYDSNEVDVIESYHLIEHLPRHELPKVFQSWQKILKPNGSLIIECPDFDVCVKKYIEGDVSQLDGIFGLQRYLGDYHYFGYNFERLSKLLADCGFSNIEKKEAIDSHKVILPCMRIECTNINQTVILNAYN